MVVGLFATVVIGFFATVVGGFFATAFGSGLVCCFGGILAIITEIVKVNRIAGVEVQFGRGESWTY